MEKLLINLQLFVLITIGLLRDVNEEIEYSEEEIYVPRKNITYYKVTGYFKAKILSRIYNRLLDINYIECMRC